MMVKGMELKKGNVFLTAVGVNCWHSSRLLLPWWRTDEITLIRFVYTWTHRRWAWEQERSKDPGNWWWQGEVMSLFAFVLDCTSWGIVGPLLFPLLQKHWEQRKEVPSPCKLHHNQTASEKYRKYHSPPPGASDEMVTKHCWGNTQDPSCRKKNPGSATLLLCVCDFSFHWKWDSQEAPEIVCTPARGHRASFRPGTHGGRGSLYSYNLYRLQTYVESLAHD